MSLQVLLLQARCEKLKLGVGKCLSTKVRYSIVESKFNSIRKMFRITICSLSQPQIPTFIEI